MKTNITSWTSNQVWLHQLSTTLLTLILSIGISLTALAYDATATAKKPYPTLHKTVEVNGIDIFYREAGNKKKPTLLLLHGYPTSSYMFRNLISDLSDKYHLLAPDYPGFGQSEQPLMAEFSYTFDNMANIIEGFIEAMDIEEFSLYLMDYGAPVGYRIASKHPERIQALIVQNGNAYTAGMTDFWNPLRTYWEDRSEVNGKALEPFHSLEGVRWQYLHGVQDSSRVSPDNWLIDMQHLKRPENNEIQLALFYDYQNNVKLYPSWQQYLRTYQPPTLIVWGKNDIIFPTSGALPYQQDLKNIEFHLLNTGHFALEEKGDEIADYIDSFLTKNKIK